MKYIVGVLIVLFASCETQEIDIVLNQRMVYQVLDAQNNSIYGQIEFKDNRNFVLTVNSIASLTNNTIHANSQTKILRYPPLLQHRSFTLSSLPNRIPHRA